MTTGVTDNKLVTTSPTAVVPTLNESASTSLWTSSDAHDGILSPLDADRRQSLASVGDESSFMRAKDAAESNDHFCSTPTRGGVDVSGHVTLVLDGQRCPPAMTPAVSERRSGCVMMPRLTPIMETHDEQADVGDDEGNLV